METELKLEVAAADLEALRRSAPLADGGAPAARHLVATYYDTAGHDLRKAGMTLRVRTDGARVVQTVKADGGPAAGLFARPEWEVELPDEHPRVDAQAGPIAPAIAGQPLLKCFTTDVSRVVGEVEQDGARIEIAVDEGEVRAGEASHPIAELELELRVGPVGALFALARRLDEVAPLRLGVSNKSDTGWRLVDGTAAGATRAEPVRLDEGGDAAGAFAAIALACLRQFRLNEALLLAGDDHPLPLHQARVALRRLRSAMSLFKPLLRGDPRTPAVSQGLRELAGALGEVRDIEVQIGQHEGATRDRLAAARLEAFAAARARLESPTTRRLMIDLVEWLAIGDWRTHPADAALARTPVAAFTTDLLDRRRKRLKRDGRHLAKLGEHDRHQVRIEAKKMRYAAEFFTALWTGKKQRHRLKGFLRAIEQLQEELGQLNDVAAGRELFARLAIPAPIATEIDVPKILARAEDAFDELIDVKRFWR